ncbi:hypothetical protein [Paeniglutamicibacter kerguelensis]|uniref:Uncharacterized protein n=1 Tax=Paeniglutamicibacter kerguelensis TaxID=254788 RepID=A0ABS4X815_9MICC|nr:hypothetical protein [Paeniglutamicibacter kerguelensis]MBP2384602.1 hypothetical protein [Paeniglutamicibacter kerguelensis]
MAASWGLSAPVDTWLWNAAERTDTSISRTGPQEFIPQLWLWALIPAGIYLTVGLFRFRKTSVQSA